VPYESHYFALRHTGTLQVSAKGMALTVEIRDAALRVMFWHPRRY
jgi:hypothetical protein